jgi:hypothetical protein
MRHWKFLVHCIGVNFKLRQWFPSARKHVPHTSLFHASVMLFEMHTRQSEWFHSGVPHDVDYCYALRTLSCPNSWMDVGFSPEPKFWEFTYPLRWNQISLLNRTSGGFIFSIVNSLKVPVRKIRSCFAICMTGLVNRSCLEWMSMQQLCWNSCWKCGQVC